MRAYSTIKFLIMTVLVYFSLFAPGFTQSQKPAAEKVVRVVHHMPAKSDTASHSGDSMTAVIELRDYRLKPGRRDDFINYFKQHFVESQNQAGAQILGLFRLKGSDNNFFWLRGFSSMAARKTYLPAFYYGPVWKTYGRGANDMLANNDDVHLLKPITWSGAAKDPNPSVYVSIAENGEGITVINFYTCNNKLDKMIDFVGQTYLPILQSLGSPKLSFWVSELAENDFPKLPVFQDKNLMVSIAHYKSETEYRKMTERTRNAMTAAQLDDFEDIATKTETLILYPVQK